MQTPLGTDCIEDVYSENEFWYTTKYRLYTHNIYIICESISHNICIHIIFVNLSFSDHMPSKNGITGRHRSDLTYHLSLFTLQCTTGDQWVIGNQPKPGDNTLLSPGGSWLTMTLFCRGTRGGCQI
jgi:hypothetical protein